MHPDQPSTPPRDLTTELFAAALDGDPFAHADLAALAGCAPLAARALAALPAFEPTPASSGAGPAPWAVAYVDQLFARVADPHRR